MANLNVNKVILCGRLTADIELKTTPSGVSVASFSVAVNKKTKEGEQKADFFNCVAWRQNAEFIAKYFRKADSIFIWGALQNRSWKDNDGNTRYATEIIVESAQFVDSKGNAQQTPTNSNTAPNFAQNQYANEPQFEEMDGDDQLPF